MEKKNDIYKELQSGTELNGGKYIIEQKIGEGGFGITYKAVQKGLNRTVCIKEYFLAGRCVRNTHARTVHLQDISEEIYEKYRRAFVKEAQTLATLHHPSIVEVIDVFDENNTSYMVMPFIEGRSLQNIVENNGPISYPEAVNYMAQITSAVEYIHERHILHRDIKPDNIMVTSDYKAILIDFGSAREFQQDKTQQHTSLLTHGYAPPEQYSSTNRKGSYTDIYALGASLYFILTGQVPTEAAARLNDPLIDPKKLNPNIPKEANRTILKAMELKTSDRYQSAKEFINDLCGGEPINNFNIPQQVISTISQNTNRKKNKWPVVVLIAAVIFLSSIIATILVIQNKKESAAREKERIEEERKINKMDSIYNANSKLLDIKLKLINEKNTLAEKGPILDALFFLKSLEDMEKSPAFNKTNITPCYQKKFDTYKCELKKKLADIEIELSECPDTNDTYWYVPLKNNYELVNNILSQSESRNASQIVIKKPENNQ